MRDWTLRGHRSVEHNPTLPGAVSGSLEALGNWGGAAPGTLVTDPLPLHVRDSTSLGIWTGHSPLVSAEGSSPRGQREEARGQRKFQSVHLAGALSADPRPPAGREGGGPLGTQGSGTLIDSLPPTWATWTALPAVSGFPLLPPAFMSMGPAPSGPVTWTAQSSSRLAVSRPPHVPQALCPGGPGGPGSRLGQPLCRPQASPRPGFPRAPCSAWKPFTGHTRALFISGIPASFPSQTGET